MIRVLIAAPFRSTHQPFFRVCFRLCESHHELFSPGFDFEVCQIAGESSGNSRLCFHHPLLLWIVFQGGNLTDKPWQQVILWCHTVQCHQSVCFGQSWNPTRNMTYDSQYTLQGINISHLGKRKIIFKMPFLRDMLVPWRVHLHFSTVNLL